MLHKFPDEDSGRGVETLGHWLSIIWPLYFTIVLSLEND